MQHFFTHYKQSDSRKLATSLLPAKICVLFCYHFDHTLLLSDSENINQSKSCFTMWPCARLKLCFGRVFQTLLIFKVTHLLSLQHLLSYFMPWQIDVYSVDDPWRIEDRTAAVVNLLMWIEKKGENKATVRVTLRKGNVLGIFIQQGQHISLQMNVLTSSICSLDIAVNSGG